MDGQTDACLSMRPWCAVLFCCPLFSRRELAVVVALTAAQSGSTRCSGISDSVKPADCAKGGVEIVNRRIRTIAYKTI